MINTQDKHSSKFLSLVLRHKPSEIGITLDEYGYAVVTDLLAGLGKRGHKLTHEDLQRIVREDGKQRYAFNADESKIKANQGHSLAVDLELTAVEPPKELYHGTATRFLASILKEGIQKQNRQYVHLSADLDTATTVGKRHGELVILVVDSEQMHKDGHQFYLSDNKVWLTDCVPTKYLNVVPN